MKRRRMVSRIEKALGLTGEVRGDASLQVDGKKQIVIENHTAIVEFTDTVIRVRTKQGGIRVRGKGLVIEGLGINGLVVNGEIESIEYLD